MPINNIPKAHKRLASAASRREQRKNSTAEIKTTNKPGSSRGNSRNPRWKSLIENVSFKKLLNVASTILWENPKTTIAAKNSCKSRGKPINLFLIRWMILLTHHNINQNDSFCSCNKVSLIIFCSYFDSLFCKSR